MWEWVLAYYCFGTLHPQDDNGRTPLSYAVAEGYSDVAQFLLKRGECARTIDSKRMGILHHAISNANCKLETVKQLLALGAPTTLVDIQDMTPLHYAVRFGRRGIAELLLRYGVSIDIAVQTETRVRKRHHDEGVALPIPPKGFRKGLTPLHYAALVGNCRMVEFLLDHGADANSLSPYGETLLHIALSKKLQGTQYSDDWTADHWKAEFLFDIIDPEDDDEYEAACDRVFNQRIGVIRALLSDSRTVVCAGGRPQVRVAVCATRDGPPAAPERRPHTDLCFTKEYTKRHT